MNTALIVAGGSGRRMKKNIRKQYLHLAGRPIIAHTLLAFGNCPHLDNIIVVLPEKDINIVTHNIIPTLDLQKPIRLVPGGKQRQESVYNGLQALYPECRIVIIHDGVRPFITSEQITTCIDTAKKDGASILGIPASDTLKKVSIDGKITATLDRRQIWLAQTPQAFKVEIIKQAHYIARQENIIGTDDASLVERLGITVSIIHGSHKNIKITTSEDLELCQAMLKSYDSTDPESIYKN
ncbi:MAG: 2-C-methyl-D-erythritol 4-phosphate cytidylyltransferase [Desulfobacteraceae bacterium]|jgi:2-C-methyl-D-erythritol 4-phosphate cytidylyltransferase